MLFKNSVRTSKRTPHFTITKINWLTLFKFNAYDNMGDQKNDTSPSRCVSSTPGSRGHFSSLFMQSDGESDILFHNAFVNPLPARQTLATCHVTQAYGNKARPSVNNPNFLPVYMTSGTQGDNDMSTTSIPSRCSSVSIVSDYGLDDRENGVRFPAKDFFL
jgi:hypothetical protein